MGKADLAWTPVKGNDLYKYLEGLTQRPSHPWVVPSMGTQGIFYEPPVPTSAWLKVVLIGFLLRGIQLTLPKNIAYFVQ